MLLGLSSENARIGPQSQNILKIKMVIRGHQDLHMAANPNNAEAIEIFVKCCPPGITMKVSSFVRHVVCKTPLNLGFDEVAFEVLYSIIRGLVSGLCVIKCDCAKLGSYENIISVLSIINIEEVL